VRVQGKCRILREPNLDEASDGSVTPQLAMHLITTALDTRLLTIQPVHPSMPAAVGDGGVASQSGCSQGA